MRVEILHNQTIGIFGGYSEADALTSKYKYDRADLTSSGREHASVVLGPIWRENNLVSGYELPHYFQTRSLSVGDVVVLTYADDVHEAWGVENVGWEPVELDAVYQAVSLGTLTKQAEVDEILGRLHLERQAPNV